MSELEIKQKTNTPEKDIKIKNIPSALPTEEMYFDGVSAVMVRGGVFKLDFYRVSGFDKAQNTEIRTTSHKVVLPSMAMPELMKALQSVVANAKETQQPTTDTSITSKH